MATLTDEQLRTATYLTGVDENGAISAQAWRNWRGDDPATYRTDISFANKWNNDANGVTAGATSKAGTPGGTVTYSFGNGVTATAQTAFTSGLTLWSDIADVTFKQVPLSSSSDVVLETDPDRGAVTMTPFSARTTPGTTDIPSALTPTANRFAYSVNVSIADNNRGFGVLGDFTTRGVSTVTHELGHVLGFGHSGPYNEGTVTGRSTQLNAYDSQQWSIMSYFHANDTSAPFAARDGVSGSNWTEAQTPMMLDVVAMQRLYGASKTTTFAGGQTYGFNCNISGSSKQYYDFSFNQAPTVTIYNAGTGNTLDCSGYRVASTINLNQGAFSSVGGLVNNVGIAYGTRVDTAIGGAGNDVIYGNGGNNRVDGGGGANTFILSGARSNFTVVATGASSAIVTDTTTGAIDTLTNIQSIQFADAPVCFTTGMRIGVMRDGALVQIAVEALRVGDTALTATGETRPIRWIGRRRIVPARHRVPSDQWPVRVLAGAFGTDSSDRPLPRHDLSLSPGHPVLVGADAANRGGVLVPIMCLVNGTSIVREQVDVVVYWHIELDGHDLLLAEGMAAESYFEAGMRAWFGEGAPPSALLDPDHATRDRPGRCRPVAIDGPFVDAERRRLDGQFGARLAGQSGWPDLVDTTAWFTAMVA